MATKTATRTQKVKMRVKPTVSEGWESLGCECGKLHIPNAETRRAIREGRSGKKGKSFTSVDSMFESILGKNWKKSL